MDLSIYFYCIHIHRSYIYEDFFGTKFLFGRWVPGERKFIFSVMTGFMKKIHEKRNLIFSYNQHISVANITIIIYTILLYISQFK